MVTKRRTVWLNDDDWQALATMAADRGVNVSQLLRGGGFTRRPTADVPPPVPFSTRPFTPVPKVLPKR